MKTHELPRVEADSRAEEKAQNAAANGKWKEFAGETAAASAMSDLVSEALFSQESENYTVGELTGEEMARAAGVVVDLLKSEQQEARTGHGTRPLEFIKADISAANIAFGLLAEEGSIEAAKERILAPDTEYPALEIKTDRHGYPVVVSGTSKNVRPDGSLSPMDTYKDGVKTLCHDYYVTQRAVQYLGYVQNHSEELGQMLLGDAPELPDVFQGNIYESETVSLDDIHS